MRKLSRTCEQRNVALHAKRQHLGHVLGVAAPPLHLDLRVVVHAARGGVQHAQQARVSRRNNPCLAGRQLSTWAWADNSHTREPRRLFVLLQQQAACLLLLQLL